MATISERRRFQDAPMTGFTIRLTAWHQIEAIRRGHGVMGQGVRNALEMCARASSINEQAMLKVERRLAERRR